MHIPPHLIAGDEIRIISTARKISLTELKPALNWITAQGFTYSFGAHLFESHHQFAGTDKQRASDFITAWKDPNVKAIWCARGGYGSARLMPLLKDLNLKHNPKWLVGYSDVSFLHAWLQKNDICSIHGTMPINVGNNTPESLISLQKLLSNQAQDYEWHGEFTAQKEITGKLIGGNLSMLYSLNGTPWQPDVTDCILFIEDLDEYLYHIDRMLHSMYYSGWFNRLKAIIVGGMTDMNDNAIPFGFSAKDSIQRIAQKANVPVVFNFPGGHQNHHLSLLFGKNTTLTMGEINKLRIG